MDKLNTEFMAAFNKGDMAALGRMYTDDAYLLPPGAGIVKGRAAIQTFSTNAAAAIGHLNVKTLGGDAAREVGTFTLMTKGDKPQEVAGKSWSSGRRRADSGSWRLTSDTLGGIPWIWIIVGSPWLAACGGTCAAAGFKHRPLH